jgi:hypothetical protein
MKEKLYGAMIPERVIERLERAADPKPRARDLRQLQRSRRHRGGRGA